MVIDPTVRSTLFFKRSDVIPGSDATVGSDAIVDSVLDAWLKSKAPVPVSARPWLLPVITPDSVSCVPTTSTLLSAPKLTGPDRLLTPVDADSVPPSRLMASAPTATACRSSVAPLATVVVAPAPAVLPRPLASVTASLPSLTVVAPL